MEKIKLCSYGCNQIAKYYFKTSNKWCCSKHWQSCPVMKMLISKKTKDGMKNKEVRQKIRKSASGKNNGMYGKFHSEETIRQLSEAKKGKNHPRYLTILKIKKKYPFFSKIEEMRYNPDKPGQKEIQVHCKNHLCKNSKEKDGWFTPTGNQLYHRANAIENPKGFGESNFYCSEKCKEDCPLYNLKGDPLKGTELPYTQVEKDIFNKEVLERQRKEDGYNFCEKCFSTKDLHVHHENPVKTHPHLALDPDNGIVLCGKCHYKYGHKTGSECSTGNLANKIQLNCNLGSSI